MIERGGSNLRDNRFAWIYNHLIQTSEGAMRLNRVFLLTGLCVVLLAGCGQPLQTLEPTPLLTGSPDVTHSTIAPTQTITASPTHTQTASPTPSPTQTLPPTSTPTATPLPFLSDPLTVENAGLVRELAVWGKGILVSVDVAAKGRRIAAASHMAVTIYDADDLTEIATWKTNTLSTALTVSDNGEWVAGSIMPKYGETVSQYTIDLWKVGGAQLTQSIALPGSPAKVAFSPDNRLIAASLSGGPWDISVFEVASGSLACLLSGHENRVTDLVFSPDGSRLYSGSHDQTMREWDLAQCQPRWITETGHRLGRIALSPSGATLLSISSIERDDSYQVILSERSTLAQIWRAGDGSSIEVLEGSDTNLSYAVFEEPSIITGDLNGVIRVIGAAGEVRSSWHVSGSPIQRLAILDENRLLVVSETGFYLLDRSSGDVLVSEERYGRSVTGVQVSPDGRFVLTYGSGLVNVLDSVTGRQVFRLPQGEKATFALFSADSSRLLVGSQNNRLIIFKIAGGETLETFTRELPVDLGAVSADGSLVALAARKATIDLYHTDPLTFWMTLKNSEQANVIAFSTDGKYITAGLTTGQIRIWSLPDGRLQTTLYKDHLAVQDVSFSADRTYLYSKAIMFGPRIWEPVSWHFIKSCSGTGHVVFGNELSPNNQLIAVSTRLFDNRLWNLADCGLLATFPLPADIANDIAFLPDGSRFFASGGYGVIYVYGIPRKSDVME